MNENLEKGSQFKEIILDDSGGTLRKIEFDSTTELFRLVSGNEGEEPEAGSWMNGSSLKKWLAKGVPAVEYGSAAEFIDEYDPQTK